MYRLLPAVIALCLCAAPARAAALAIVIALDVSASVSADSYILERDGTARAFADPRLIDEITAVPGGIEALALEWSDPGRIAVTVEWAEIADARSAARFAAALHATTRSSQGSTAIGPALAAAAAQFSRLPQPAARWVIDISGDGIANRGGPPQRVRDRLVKEGIAINGLAIAAGEPWLADYYRHNVIGGPGGFVLKVSDFRGFVEAMRQKLTAEVAGGRPRRSARMPIATEVEPAQMQ